MNTLSFLGVLDLKQKKSKTEVLNSHSKLNISFFVLSTKLLLLCGLTAKVFKIPHKLQLLPNLYKAYIVCCSLYTET